MLRFPPKTILVPFDLSEASLAALEHAKGLCRDFRSRLECLYVEEPVPIEALPNYWATIHEPGYRKRLLARLRKAAGPGPRLTLQVGDPAAEILRAARARKPDLIVMGTPGRSGIARLLMGSVTEAVVAGSPVPVLAMRGPAPVARSVLAPVNFTDYSDLGLNYAAGVASILGARLAALHVKEGPAEPGFRLNERLLRIDKRLRLPAKPRGLVRTGKAVEEIAREAAKHDLVIMVSHPKGALRDAVLATTIEGVLRACPVPVLSVPSSAARLPAALRVAAASRA
jgi:nucleotide-binding universal stress UspA family protein